MSKELETIFNATTRIRRTFSLLREINTTLSDGSLIDRNVHTALVDARNALMETINADMQTLDSTPPWRDKLWPTLEAELGRMNETQKTNIARTFGIIIDTLKSIINLTLPTTDPPRTETKATKVEPLVLAPEPQTNDEKAVLNVLKGNRYLSLDEIQHLVERDNKNKFPPPYLRNILDLLAHRGQALHKTFVYCGLQASAWKKPTKTYRKMRTGEWKQMIVAALDQAPNGCVSHEIICNRVKEMFPAACAGKNLHGCVGSALDRLTKDGKLRRFHREGTKQLGYRYWVTPKAKGEVE